MLKHILLSTTIRHLFRSKQLTVILQRLGHCKNYNFTLELETALTKALDEVSTSLTPQIVTGEGNQLVHFEWDNLNKITTNIHGQNMINSTGGILIQETKLGTTVNTQQRTLPSLRSETRSLRFNTPETLAPVHLYNKVGPIFPKDAGYISSEKNNAYFVNSMQNYYAWLFIRFIGSQQSFQTVPAFGGFVSATGKIPPKKSTIEYLTPINQPFTEYSVIKELLRLSEEATSQVGQDYVINTFDLGGCMKALPFIWSNPNKYKHHIIIPGTFHTVLNYMGVVTGRKCRGSGYAELLVESGLVTSGCLESVLKGKAYAKALFCLKTVCEAMERLLMLKYIEEEDENFILNVQPSLSNLFQNICEQNLNHVLQDQNISNMINRYKAYQEKVRDGHLGKTASFWISVIDNCHIIFMMLYAVKTNSLELLHKTSSEMASLFFAYDGQNYSRYVIFYLHLFVVFLLCYLKQSILIIRKIMHIIILSCQKAICIYFPN